MKNLLFTIVALLLATAGYATCTAGFGSTTYSPLNNSLLRYSITNNSSTGTLTSTQMAFYTIRFGDGNSSSTGGTGTVTHNYASTGTYTLVSIVEIWDSTGSSTSVVCRDTTTTSLTVAYGSCATSYTISYGTGGQVTFTATNPAGTSGMTYSWNYGDGSSAGSGSPVTHTYATNGNYTVVLTASSTSASCTYTNTQTATVTSTVSSVNCSTAGVSFTSSQSGAVTNFVGSYTNPTPATGLIRMYHWDFGDGYTSNSQNPSHNYAANGSYNVEFSIIWTDSFFTICADTTNHTVSVSTIPNQIKGALMIDSFSTNPANPTFKVWLIYYNASTSMLTAVDSQNVTGSFYGGNFTFTNPPAGSYRVKAMCTNGPSSGNGPLPTYSPDKAYWNASGINVITYSGGISSNNNIKLNQGTVTSGPGFVAGNVNLGANKGTKGTGVPAANVEVLIRDASNVIIAYAITDANGHYSFNNLAYGTYNIYPEEINYTVTPLNVTLSATNDSAKLSDFNMGTISHSFTPILIINGVPSVTAETISIFPNPSTGVVNIAWEAGASETAHVVISDIIGNKVAEKDIHAGREQINIGQYNAGVYFINISSGSAAYNNKVILQK